MERDGQALQHQRYLIDGVLKSIKIKKQNYASASKGLVKTKTEKWLKTHDSQTELA